MPGDSLHFVKEGQANRAFLAMSRHEDLVRTGAGLAVRGLPEEVLVHVSESPQLS